MSNHLELSLSHFQRAVFSVDTVLKMCGLEKYDDAIVGSLGVEHRKRTTIGVELAAKVRNEEPNTQGI